MSLFLPGATAGRVELLGVTNLLLSSGADWTYLVLVRPESLSGAERVYFSQYSAGAKHFQLVQQSPGGIAPQYYEARINGDAITLSGSGLFDFDNYGWAWQCYRNQFELGSDNYRYQAFSLAGAELVDISANLVANVGGPVPIPVYGAGSQAIDKLFHGEICHSMFFNAALSDINIANAIQDPGFFVSRNAPLVSFYHPFKDNVIDYSGNAVHGTILGTGVEFRSSPILGAAGARQLVGFELQVAGPAGSTMYIEALEVKVTYEASGRTYDSVDWNKKRKVSARHKMYEILFPYLDPAELLFLRLLATQAAPRVDLDGSWVNVRIEGFSEDEVGSTLTIINEAPE